MFTATAFALFNLVLYVSVLVVVGVAARRGHNLYRGRDSRVRYRRISTAAALKRIRRETPGG